MDNRTVKEIFWDVLPEKMREAGFRITDLAKSLDLNKATVSNWVNRKAFPEMDNVQRIADVLNCRTDELLGQDFIESDIDFDRILISSFYAADASIQAAVCKLLDIKGRR